MSAPTVLVTEAADIRTITLHRPERRNALIPQMQEELIAALTAETTARVILLTGSGESFCAGLDLSELQQMESMTLEQHRIEAERLNRMFRALWECDVPTIAVVHGAAIAGGTGLATLCDFTLAAPEAQFGFTEVRIGFIPALVSAYLALQVGDKTARSLLLTARRFGAEEAKQLGLVNEVVPREHLHTRADEVASELMMNSPESLRATKQLLRAQHAAWLDSALALAMESNAASRQTADFREGVASFLEKRKPHWTASS
jgi:methylglutaconyl-CoA hydratase